MIAAMSFISCSKSGDLVEIDRLDGRLHLVDRIVHRADQRW